MRISPAQAGPVAVDLRVFNHALQRYTETKEVKVTAALPARGIAPIAFRVRRANPSRFAAAGTLPIPGTWRITVTLRVSAFDEYTSHVDVAIR
jgi:copper transport protein